MNILLYRYGSICEEDVIDAFNELGFHVDTITEEISNKLITPSRQLELVKQALSKKDYQLVFSINFFPIISEVCNIFQLPYISLVVDSPVLELYSNSIKNPWNRIFLFDKALYDEFASYNPECIFHIPLATNVKRWDKVLADASSSKRQKYSSKISFVGSLYTEKCPYDNLKFPSNYEQGYLEGMCKAQEKVYGYFFLEEVLSDTLVDAVAKISPTFYPFPENSRRNDKAALAQLYMGARVAALERVDMMTALGKRFPVDLYSGSDASALPVTAKGLVKTHTEMPLVFHGSQINLNITAKSIRTGIPLRVWDVLGCRGFLISNYQTEIPDYLTPGEDLVLYSSEEELVELCAYYLAHPNECQEIAQNGYEKVKMHHTYVIRISQILKAAFRL